ncbi:hypothetical protein [Vallitalea guaymasensis]|uniref:hypothetical protein n=1 Tax=Vallitalea guaymasensis TaxID=1185412 RepID=UPI000DE51F73|nr:hypothetical protein [Vallitalea guaymasensis]
MYKKLYIVILVILIGITGCNKPNNLPEEVEKIVKLESNNYQLWYFNITYDQYKNNIEGVLDESSINKDDEVIFGHNDEKYKGKDLIGLDIDQIKEYRAKMKKSVLWLYDIDELKVEVQISDVYYDEKEDIKYVYTLAEKVTNNGKNMVLYTNFRYSFKQIDGIWKVFKIDKSSASQGEDNTIQLYDELEYLYHNGEPISFIKTINPLTGGE